MKKSKLSPQLEKIPSNYFEVFQYLQNCNVRRSTAREAVDKFYSFVRETPQDPSNEDGDVDAWRLMLWKQALGPGLSARASTAYAIWKEIRTRHLCLGAELEDLLLELRKCYKLGLITNGPSSAQWDKIRRVNASNYFDVIIVSGDVKHAKPSPAIFEEAFRRLDASSLECVMVGDRLDTDIKGAMKANCAVTVWVSDSDASLEDVHPKPDFKVSHVREILDLLPESKGFSSLCKNRTLGVFHSLRDDAQQWRKDH
ncbi:N-acylneuraminate-9-phosphatase-like [Uloborus diversus]|uniref:N-acylneuraminate-9-phosphatase-like n=1 Tax=Uloborus diversus TaxID=327109 RepID=UPI0024093F0C|nr:N-acylneuraminate-9-phosphatase-like [Uloborus diversus]